MEDYDKFVQFRLSQLKKIKFNDVYEDKPKSSSLICFHGRPILPPLLSETEREKMCTFKEAARKAAENKNHKDDPRMSYVQTILHSVVTRKTPTLEEVLKESDESSSLSGLLSLQSSFAKKSPSQPFKTTEMVMERLHALTSTICNAPMTSDLLPQISSEISHDFSQASDTGLDYSSPKTCHQSSSGYESYTNVENTVSAIDSQKDDIYFSGEDSVECFLVRNLSDTVKKMPDIINYPPVDGEELERTGEKSSFDDNLKADNPELAAFISLSSAEESSGVFPDQSEHKETSHLPSDDDQEVAVKVNLSDPPKDTPAPKSLTEIHTRLNDTIQTDKEDSKPLEKPYRMSLQALLKKSQECSQRQRMFRSQAKNAKIQDRAQDQPKSEEQSLSDKENDEQFIKGAEPRKNQESDSHSPFVDQTLKKSHENDWKTEHIYDKSHSDLIRIDKQPQEFFINHDCESYDSIKINNWVNTSGSRNLSLLEPIWAEYKNDSSECRANISPTVFSDVKKYHKIPALNICRSPVPCKVKSPSPPFDKNSQMGEMINTSMNNQIEESSSGTSPLNVMESDVTSVLAKSSQHIDQLEFNLSGLKVLISDLESTLKENLDKSSSHSESLHGLINLNNSVCYMGDFCLSQKSQSLGGIKSQTETAVNMQQLVTSVMTSREKDHTRPMNAQNTKKTPSPKFTLSATQRMQIPEMFRTCLPEATTQNNIPVLSVASNHPVKMDLDVDHDSRSTSLNQSYDVDTPSELWLHSMYGFQQHNEKQMTPESGGEAQGVRSKVKRRLQMTEVIMEKGDTRAASRPSSSTTKAAAQLNGGLNNVKEREDQLKRIHAAQVRALQEEHLRQEDRLLQALAARYSLLQSMSLPCSVSTSRLGDTATLPTLFQSILSAVAMSRYDIFITTLSNSHALLALHWYNQQSFSSPLLEHYCHLLSAAAKGFLTRRLLKTEKVAQLVRTVRDTQQFLQAFNKGLPTRQDLMLQERVMLQLRATRYEIHDIFFNLTSRERMQLISSDRHLVRERELKRQNGSGGQQKRVSSLSGATKKLLERKRDLMIQKKTVERHKGVSMRTRHKPGFSAEQPLETRAGQYRANPQRVPKSTYTSRPR